MPITATPITGQGTGLLITPSDTEPTLSAIAPSLVGLLADAGHLLLRGFEPTLTEFNELVEDCSARVTLDPARQFYGSVAQKVDSGLDAIGLHIENGATPNPPDLLWFHCIVAAAEGSATIVCDGRRVWDRLDAPTRQLFLESPIVFSRNVSESHWRQFTAFSLGGGRTAQDVTISDLRSLTSGNVTSITERPDGSIHYAFTSHAAHGTRWSDDIAWANSIFGPSFNYEAPDIRFADGSEIPPKVLDKLANTAEEVTEEIAWQNGDVVLIDNSRVMHGRRAILDPRRTIVNAQSYAAA